MNTILLLSDGVMIALIGFFGLVTTTIGTIIVTRLGSMKTQLDGRLTELLNLTAIAKKAEGKDEGIEQARQNQVVKDAVKSAEAKDIRDSNKPTEVTIVNQKEELPVEIKKDATKP